jgi:transcription elongation factor Elf1
MLDPSFCMAIDTKKFVITTCPVCGQDKPDAFRIYFDGYEKLFRCSTCDHVTQFPGPGGNTIMDSYDEFYDLDFVKKGQEWMYPYRQNVLTDIAKRALKIVGQGKKLLDVGAGDGQFMYRAEALGFDCTGVEPSEALSKYAAGKVQGQIIKGYYKKISFQKRASM